MGVNKNIEKVCFFWFRRDLRLEDNAGLYYALKSPYPVIPIFIFDADILNKLNDKKDPRVTFIYNQVITIQEILVKKGSSILIRVGKPEDIFKDLLDQFDIASVYTNNDYEPYGIKRDLAIKNLLLNSGITFNSYKDQVIFEKDEVTGEGGKNYRVYTPYKNKWLKTLNNFYLKSYPNELYLNNFYKTTALPIPALEDIGFSESDIAIPGKNIVELEIKNYQETRNFPNKNTTSRLSIHLRFGTISIRKIASIAQSLNDTWLSELIWREFFMQLLYHNPQVVEEPFNGKFKNLKWRHNELDFEKWCNGKTGYPLVDAGMRELNATNFMHNRVRLVTASFLTKHLLIDYKWGEAYFAEKLLDFDQSANNGNWQWSAGTGADAQPFFRIFNPILQQERFDANFEYIKKWVPEYGTSHYPKPMIDHKIAVTRAKDAFGLLKSN